MMRVFASLSQFHCWPLRDLTNDEAAQRGYVVSRLQILPHCAHLRRGLEQQLFLSHKVVRRSTIALALSCQWQLKCSLVMLGDSEHSVWQELSSQELPEPCRKKRTLMRYPQASPEQLQAPSGKFRVIGVDLKTAATATYHLGDFDAFDTADKIAREKATVGNPVFIYDDKRELVVRYGSWH